MIVGAAWNAPAQHETTDPGRVVSVSASYSAPSADIIAGLAPGRYVAALSADYDLRIHRNRTMDYRWEFEVLPLMVVSDPREVSDLTITLTGSAPQTTHSDQLLLTPCASASYSGPYYEYINGSFVQVGTFSETNQCSTTWTYAGGLSPLGQRVNFRPRERWQPYVIANAGFLAATRKIPLGDATQFNFTAEVGGGIEYFRAPNRSWAIDVRYHHISNAGRGDSNPAIENMIFRLSYRVGR